MTHDRRDEVLLRYGLKPGPHPDYEIDHLIPLCLGGSDDFTNLWPQPRNTTESRWNAEAKDRLERRLCDMVCAGKTDLTSAQEEIAADWIAAFLKYFRVKDFRDEWGSIPDPNERWLFDKHSFSRLSPEKYEECKQEVEKRKEQELLWFERGLPPPRPWPQPLGPNK